MKADTEEAQKQCLDALFDMVIHELKENNIEYKEADLKKLDKKYNINVSKMVIELPLKGLITFRKYSRAIEVRIRQLMPADWYDFNDYISIEFVSRIRHSSWKISTPYREVSSVLKSCKFQAKKIAKKAANLKKRSKSEIKRALKAVEERKNNKWNTIKVVDEVPEDHILRYKARLAAQGTSNLSNPDTKVKVLIDFKIIKDGCTKWFRNAEIDLEAEKILHDKVDFIGNESSIVSQIKTKLFEEKDGN